MNRSVNSILAVWVLLMLGTAASTWGFSLPSVDPITSTVSIMVISAVKASLVMFYFMELRHAPRGWQIAGSVWLVLVAIVVIWIYLLGNEI